MNDERFSSLSEIVRRVKARELTALERELVASAPFAVDRAGMQMYIAGLLQCVVQAYESGELTLREGLQIIDAASVFDIDDRVVFLGIASALALRVRRRPRNAKRPMYPESLRGSAAALVEMLREANPEMALGPKAAASRSIGRDATVLDLALRWIKALRLFGKHPAPTAKTLHNWYLERVKRSRADAMPRTPHTLT